MVSICSSLSILEIQSDMRRRGRNPTEKDIKSDCPSHVTSQTSNQNEPGLATYFGIIANGILAASSYSGLHQTSSLALIQGAKLRN